MESPTNTSSYTPASPHPYRPFDAIVPGYEPNASSMLVLLSAFSSACTILFSTIYFVAKSVQPKITRTELVTIMWFVLSGSIHMVFEGYYVRNYASLGSKQTLLGQMWKEYALSDSRYLTSNSFVFCVESITAIVWGPGCMLVALLVLWRHPLRYPLQALVSFAQMYGDILYYATAAFDHIVRGISHSRSEPFYFWFYFVFMNALWILVPAILIAQSTVKTAQAMSTVQRFEQQKKEKEL